MILKIKAIASSILCLLFSSVAFYGAFYAEAENALSAATLSAGFGLVFWMKWTEHSIELEKIKLKKEGK